MQWKAIKWWNRSLADFTFAAFIYFVRIENGEIYVECKSHFTNEPMAIDIILHIQLGQSKRRH